MQAVGDLPGESNFQFFATPKGLLGGQTLPDAHSDRKFSAMRCTAKGFGER